MINARIITVLSLLVLPTASTSAFSQQKAEPFDAKHAVSIMGPITSETLNVVPKLLKAAEMAASPAGNNRVDVVLNSPGGEVDTGFLLISAFEHVRSLGVTIRCYVPHIAASMAFQLLLHCDERNVLQRSFLLFHRVRVYFGGNLFAPPTVITAPAADALRNELLAMDDKIYHDLEDILDDLSDEDLKRHFEMETMHIAADLCAISDAFSCFNVVPGLFPYLLAEVERANAAPPVNFRPGTIIYMKEGTLNNGSSH